MNKTIGVTELRHNFRRIVDELAQHGESCVLTRHGRPEVALIPYDDYLRFRQVQETVAEVRMALLVAKMGERNALFSDKEIEADPKAAD